MGGMGKETGGRHRKETYSSWPSRTLSIIRLNTLLGPINKNEPQHRDSTSTMMADSITALRISGKRSEEQ